MHPTNTARPRRSLTRTRKPQRRGGRGECRHYARRRDRDPCGLGRRHVVMLAESRAGLKAGRIAAMRRQTRARSATRLAKAGPASFRRRVRHSCCAGILRGVRIAPASAKNVRTPYVRHGPTVGADNRAKPAAATGVRPAIGLRAVACSTWARLTASTASLPRPAGRGALSRSTISSMSTGCVLGLG